MTQWKENLNCHFGQIYVRKVGGAKRGQKEVGEWNKLKLEVNKIRNQLCYGQYIMIKHVFWKCRMGLCCFSTDVDDSF